MVKALIRDDSIESFKDKESVLNRSSLHKFDLILYSYLQEDNFEGLSDLRLNSFNDSAASSIEQVIILNNKHLFTDKGIRMSNPV